MNHRVLSTATFALSILLVISGCSSVAFKADFDESAPFADYTTFHVMKSAVAPAGEIGADPIAMRRIERAIESELITRGLRSDSQKKADLLIAYHTGNGGMVDVDTWGYRYGTGWNQSDHRTFGEGTLIIDLVDRESMELVWRGWAKGVLDDQEETQVRINSAVVEILGKYPPHKG